MHQNRVAFVCILLLQMSLSEAELRNEKYESVKTEGELQCSIDEPTESVNVRSKIECSGCCTKHDDCLSYNFKKSSDRTVRTGACDLYMYKTTNFTTVPDCQHYRKVSVFLCR